MQSQGDTIASNRILLSPFAKQWTDIYDDAMIPKDDFPYVEDLRRFSLEPERGCVELFVRPYDDDFISPSLKTIIRLYGSVKKTDLEMQTKATIWLDDRTYRAYIHPNTFVSPLTHGHQNHKSMPSPNLVESDNQSQGNSDRNYTTNSIPSVAEDPYTQSASARYSPTSRRPKVPLTAKMLYTFLREEVIILQPVRAFRFLFFVHRDTYRSHVVFPSRNLVIWYSFLLESDLCVYHWMFFSANLMYRG